MDVTDVGLGRTGVLVLRWVGGGVCVGTGVSLGRRVGIGVFAVVFVGGGSVSNAGLVGGGSVRINGSVGDNGSSVFDGVLDGERVDVTLRVTVAIIPLSSSVFDGEPNRSS